MPSELRRAGRRRGDPLGDLRRRPLVRRGARRVHFLVRESRLVDAECTSEHGDEDPYLDGVAQPRGGAPIAASEDDLNVVTVEAIEMLLLDQNTVHGAEHESG